MRGRSVTRSQPETPLPQPMGCTALFRLLSLSFCERKIFPHTFLSYNSPCGYGPARSAGQCLFLAPADRARLPITELNARMNIQRGGGCGEETSATKSPHVRPLRTPSPPSRLAGEPRHALGFSSSKLAADHVPPPFFPAPSPRKQIFHAFFFPGRRPDDNS